MSRRWTQGEVESLQARMVGPGGTVSQHAVRTTALVSKRQKYGRKPTWFDGVYFGSHRELQRYKDLKLMQDADAISGLGIHPRYDLYACGVKLGYVELDFEYLDVATGKMVYEDVKSPTKNSSTRTAISKWKLKHLEAEHGIRVSIVT
jgi:hypothetical protein